METWSEITDTLSGLSSAYILTWHMTQWVQDQLSDYNSIFELPKNEHVKLQMSFACSEQKWRW